jgi:membrane fusion protein, adhesin transport system
MLNISPVSIVEKINKERYKSFLLITNLKIYTNVKRVILYIFLILIMILFFPWTQNVQGDGIVTTLQPEHRPQTIQSVISGRIVKWHVNEGDFLKAGDTILQIAEIQDAYFDPELLKRTGGQIDAREAAIGNFGSRIEAIENKIKALENTRQIKLLQIENKIRQAELSVKSDSIQLEASKTEMQVAELQLTRSENLIKNGLVSLTDLEKRKIRRQEAESRLISAENKLLISQNELLNAIADRIGTENEFRDKIASATADLYSVRIGKLDAQVNIDQMRNKFVNIETRVGFRHVLAPQDGYLAQALVTGVGENVKEGQPLVSIMPANYELAVAFYIRPIDLPLMKVGKKVRFIFDGWPAFVFSGWPQISFGSFGGEVVAIDNFTDVDNAYRVLVKPDANEDPWPRELRVGSGAKGFALLSNVPIYYELWRQLNGFPPEFYDNSEKGQKDTKRKEPLRLFK